MLRSMVVCTLFVCAWQWVIGVCGISVCNLGDAVAWAQAGDATTLGSALLPSGGPAAVTAAPTVVAPPSFGELISKMMPMFLILFFIIYFMVLRPQNDKLKAHAALMSSLKKGDQVVTSSGLIARVAGIEKEYILLEISQGVRAKFETSHVVKLFEEPKVPVAQAG